jgi:hypothetical protein
MLLNAMSRDVVQRMQLNEPARDDQTFRTQILRAGKTSEHWHYQQLADRPLPAGTTPTVEPPTGPRSRTTQPAAAKRSTSGFQG